MAGDRLKQGNDEQRGAGDDSPLWSRTADGNSGVRLKRPESTQKAQLLSGQYRLGAALGPSSYGRAFMAEQMPQGRPVTVHFLPRDATSERVLSRELPLAVAKCAQLSHPNVVGVEGYGRADSFPSAHGAQTHVDEGLYYVVTAPVDGISLGDYLDASGPLPVQQALSLMRQIGRALRAAHKLGIVHGDIRPANVRIVETPQGELARVVGFGKAVLFSRDAEPTSEIRGITSPVYAAPELYHSGQVDARSDVYSLGALLFRLIAGEPPYPGRTPAEVMDGHLHAPVPSLSARAPATWVPPEVDALVRRCLEKDPKKRFPDVVAFMQAMRFALLDDSEFLSREASDVLSLPPGVNSILPSVPAAPVEPEEEAKLAPRNRWLWVVLGALLALAVVGEILWEAHGSRLPARESR